MNEEYTLDFLRLKPDCSVDELCESILLNAPYIVDWPVYGKRITDIRRFTNRRTRNCQYHQFEIPKKSGGTRKIIAPTSPILSNMVCEVLDEKLSELAKSYGLTYSRYADDITFSSNHSVYSNDSSFWPKLRSTITKCGFQINEAKTRLLKKGSRQEVTGITVGEKLNVSRKWMKRLRAQVFDYEMYGGSDEEYRSIMGKIAFLKMVRGNMDERACRLYNRARQSHHEIPMMEQHWY